MKLASAYQNYGLRYQGSGNRDASSASLRDLNSQPTNKGSLHSIQATMAAVDVGARDVPPINDDIDELFNYEVDNDLFQEVDTNMDVAPKQPSARTRDGTLEGGLGLDEEIKITKKRAPISKLDESRCVHFQSSQISSNTCRLLSQAGIPRLRRIAKERLRFKGKGHEVGNDSRSTYHN